MSTDWWGKFIACEIITYKGGRQSARIVLEDMDGLWFVEMIEIGEKAYQ